MREERAEEYGIEDYSADLIRYMQHRKRKNRAVYIGDIMKKLNLDTYEVVDMIDECIARELIELKVMQK